MIHNKGWNAMPAPDNGRFKQMQKESGSISINTENIFPIIKKWLYSDKDIFLRELVSNACDAISRHKKLVAIGEAVPDAEKGAEGAGGALGTAELSTAYRIDVVNDGKKKTITISDNGIGMTDEEVKKYINQIAFSGVMEFVEKYKDKTDSSQIIGHFGLGFYSVFMVAEKVTIDTLSYLPGAEAVRWTSKDGMEFELVGSDRKARGTTVTIKLDDESKEFAEAFKIREILRKYCAFMPFEIYFTDLEEKERKKKEDKERKEKEEKERKEKEKKEPASEVIDVEPIIEPIKTETPINDTTPLWIKNPKDCTEQEYKDFYSKVFLDFNEPLFWIHLNMDYPFNLKGILYFPKLKHEFQSYEGQIKLFYNQVFVADNIKEIIPEFLMLLKGAIDCPDLPLNVSRSFLQNDGYVKRISTHIIKKVADKLTSLYESERESYNKYWEDINPFVKYGCMREDKFYDKVKDIIIYRTTKGDHVNLKEYLERNKDKHENKVFYVTDEKQQAQYIKRFRDHDMEAVALPTLIDTSFVNFMEMKENKIKFLRIDSDLSDNLKDKTDAGDDKELKAKAETLEKLFRESLANDKLKIQLENLKTDSTPGMILLSEQSRRMQEMSKIYGGVGLGDYPAEETLVLNNRNPLIKKLIEANDIGKEDASLICNHIYDLAMLSHKQLEPEMMTRFIERSNKVLQKFAGML